MSTTQISGSLITRNYNNFRGVDFSNRKDEVNLYRSPDALNMWKNYKNSKGKCIETRPDIAFLSKFENTVFGLFFYTYENEKHIIVHSGTELYDNDNLIYENMAEQKSLFFIYDKILYIKDGRKYLQYDGKEVKEVEGTIPTTTIARSPLGGGSMYQDVNMLTGIRKNTFIGDGTTKEYYLDSEIIDEDYTVKAWINGTEVTDFTVEANLGKIVFNVAPEAPLTDGQANVEIEFRKTIPGYRERIEKCRLLAIFDNRVFFSGNPDYPNKVWHCSLNDPSYVSDLDYYDEGIDDSKIKALVVGNNALWIFKEASQTDTTIFYHNPTIDDETGKVYPSIHSSISTGCVSTGINFNDDIVFFSERGLEGITGDVTTEQVLTHRSSLIDNRLLNEEKYLDVALAEWEGYLLAACGKHVYLADSRAYSVIDNHNEYEWYYWEFEKDISEMIVDNGILYIVSGTEIYTLTKTEGVEIESYWTTIEDEFGYPQYQKITNKKGCTVDMEGQEVTIYAKTDNTEFDEIKRYENIKGYVVPRIKKKKWKALQLKFSSYLPFGLYSATLESYIGSYVKR